MKLNRKNKKDIFKERYNLIKRTRVVIVGHPEITNLNIYKKAAKTMRELEKKHLI